MLEYVPAGTLVLARRVFTDWRLDKFTVTLSATERSETAVPLEFVRETLETGMSNESAVKPAGG
jgi:hypothetical protein